MDCFSLCAYCEAVFKEWSNIVSQDKKAVKLNEQDDPLYVEGFALNVFAKADKQDRAGKADL
jgi:vacuolar protein sorting-associated protein VTA1